PPGFVLANRQQRKISRTEPLAYISKERAIPCVPGEVETGRSSLDSEATPQRAIAIERASGREMLRRSERDDERLELEPSPPVALFDSLDASGPDQPSIAEWRHDEGIETLGEPAKRGQIAVVVVVVAEQHDRYGWQIIEGDCRVAHPARTDQ